MGPRGEAHRALSRAALAAGGPLDLVDHGRSGYLFDPHVRGDLARWVGELVESPGLREAMGAGSRIKRHIPPVLFFLALARWAFSRGIRKYTAVGG